MDWRIVGVSTKDFNQFVAARAVLGIVAFILATHFFSATSILAKP